MAVTIPIPPTLYSATPHPIALLSEGVGESGCKLLPKSPRAQETPNSALPLAMSSHPKTRFIARSVMSTASSTCSALMTSGGA